MVSPGTINAGECRLRVCPCSEHICQLRLDFSTFVINQPDTCKNLKLHNMTLLVWYHSGILEGIQTSIMTPYHIHANKRPLSIRLPLWHNSNKTALFCSKSPLLGAFWGKNWKSLNTPPLKKPQSFIERRPFNSADTVISFFNFLKFSCIPSYNNRCYDNWRYQVSWKNSMPGGHF